MKRFFRKCYIELRIQLRILRLYFVRMQIPDDAKTPEQMLEEIKKRSKLTQITVMITRRMCDLFAKPVRCYKGKRIAFGRKFYFRKPEVFLGCQEDIKLYGIGLIGDFVTSLADKMAIYLSFQMLIGFLCQRKIILLSYHKSFGFVS